MPASTGRGGRPSKSPGGRAKTTGSNAGQAGSTNGRPRREVAEATKKNRPWMIDAPASWSKNLPIASNDNVEPPAKRAKGNEGRQGHHTNPKRPAKVNARGRGGRQTTSSRPPSTPKFTPNKTQVSSARGDVSSAAKQASIRRTVQRSSESDDDREDYKERRKAMVRRQLAASTATKSKKPVSKRGVDRMEVDDDDDDDDDEQDSDGEEFGLISHHGRTVAAYTHTEEDAEGDDDEEEEGEEEGEDAFDDDDDGLAGLGSTQAKAILDTEAPIWGSDFEDQQAPHAPKTSSKRRTVHHSDNGYDNEDGDNEDGYGDNEDGYGDNEDGYGDNEDGYGDNEDGYGDNQDGYGDNQDGYDEGNDYEEEEHAPAPPRSKGRKDSAARLFDSDEGVTRVRKKNTPALSARERKRKLEQPEFEESEPEDEPTGHARHDDQDDEESGDESEGGHNDIPPPHDDDIANYGRWPAYTNLQLSAQGRVNKRSQSSLVKALLDAATAAAKHDVAFVHAYPESDNKAAHLFQIIRDCAFKVDAALYDRTSLQERYTHLIAGYVSNRISLYRRDIKKAVEPLVPVLYNLHATVGNNPRARTPQEIEERIRQLKYEDTFIFPDHGSDDPSDAVVTKPFGHAIFGVGLRAAFFSGSNSIGNLFPDDCPIATVDKAKREIPKPMMALIATAVYAVLGNWSAGVFTPNQFHVDNCLGVYKDFLDTLDDVEENAGANRFSRVMCNAWEIATKNAVVARAKTSTAAKRVDYANMSE